MNPLLTMYRMSERGASNSHDQAVAVRSKLGYAPGVVDMALDDVAAKPAVWLDRPLEVDPLSHGQLARRRSTEGLGLDVNAERGVGALDDGEADSVDRDAVAKAQV